MASAPSMPVPEPMPIERPPTDAYLVAAPVDTDPAQGPSISNIPPAAVGGWGDFPPPPRPAPVNSIVREEDLRREIELLPKPPPPPPRLPFWTGIYSFPFRRENLFVWLILAGGLTLPVGITSITLSLISKGGFSMGFIPPLIAVWAVVAFVTGSITANYFVAVVDQTAAGNDRVAWPEVMAIVEGMGHLVYLIWLGLVCAAPLALIGVFGGKVGVGTAVLLSVVLFPIVLISSRAGVSHWWTLLHRRVLRELLRKPLIIVFLSVPAVLLLLASANLAVVVQESILRGIVCGVAWPPTILIYGRIVGRSAYLLTFQDNVRKHNWK
jgi:hypothetical protein